MTHEQIAELGAEVRSVLDEQDRAVVEYCPGNGTRYVVVIVKAIPSVRMVGYSFAKPEDSIHSPGDVVHKDGRPEVWFVAVENYGTSCTLIAKDEPPFPVYLAEKLTNGNMPDAAALRLLLGAVVGADVTKFPLREAGIRGN